MELTAQFTIYDYCVLGIFALFIARGLWLGFLGQIIGLLALYVGFLAAGRFSGDIAPWIRPLTNDPKVIAFLAWILAFALAWVVVALVGKLFMRVVRVTVAGGFDRLAGAALGFLKAGLLIVIVHMILASTLPASNNLTRGCVTCPTLDQTSNFCRAFITDSNTRDAFMRKTMAIPIEAMKRSLNGTPPSGAPPAAADPATASKRTDGGESSSTEKRDARR